MSILIKGMEMPKNCGECTFCLKTVTRYGYIYAAECTARGMCLKFSELDLRDGLCPLIELPTPHGRLIDADALKWNYIRIRDDGIKEFSQYGIDRAPTIIPAEPCNDLAKPNKRKEGER